MPYLPSKIPLKEGLELAASNTGLTPGELEKLKKLKSEFRRALQLGDIRAEGRILVHDSGCDGDDWSPLLPIPREFFEDNEGRDYIRWLVERFGAVDKAPEEYFQPTREVVPGFGRSRLYDEEDGEPASRLGAITEAGRAELGALGRPDFERNCTGDPGPPHQNPRRAIAIRVLREDVERCFRKQPSETSQATDKKPGGRSLRGEEWTRPALEYLKEWVSKHSASFPLTPRALAQEVRKELELGDEDRPVEGTVYNQILKWGQRGGGAPDAVRKMIERLRKE